MYSVVLPIYFLNIASVFHVRLHHLILTSRFVTAGCGNFRRGKHTITTNVSLVSGRGKKASDLIETSTNVNYMEFCVSLYSVVLPIYFLNIASVFHVRLHHLILTSRFVTAGCGNFRRGKHTITTNVSLVSGRGKKASDLIETLTNVNYVDFAIT